MNLNIKEKHASIKNNNSKNITLQMVNLGNQDWLKRFIKQLVCSFQFQFGVGWKLLKGVLCGRNYKSVNLILVLIR